MRHTVKRMAVRARWLVIAAWLSAAIVAFGGGERWAGAQTGAVPAIPDPTADAKSATLNEVRTALTSTKAKIAAADTKITEARQTIALSKAAKELVSAAKILLKSAEDGQREAKELAGKLDTELDALGNETDWANRAINAKNDAVKAGEKAQHAATEATIAVNAFKSAAGMQQAKTVAAEIVAAAEKAAAEKPAAEKPAAEKPAAEKPAAEKPAAEKPAAEKPAAEKAAVSKDDACTRFCTGNLVICLDATTGKPFCEAATSAEAKKLGTVPDRVIAGDTVTIRVIGHKGNVFKLTLSTLRTSEHLFGPGTPQPAPIPDVSKKAAEPAYEQLEESKTLIPDDTAVTSLSIKLEAGAKKEPTETYTIDIDHGRYFLEMGFLMAFVPDGSRKVGGTAIPGTGGGQTLAVRETWHVAPSVVLNVFPCGRRRGLISSFKKPGWQIACDLFGFQAGIDLDLSKPLDQFYVGTVIEPVAGLSLTFGLALLQGEFVPENYQQTMLLPHGEPFTPDVKYMPRFYMGFTTTLDILSTVSRAVTAARGVTF